MLPDNFKLKEFITTKLGLQEMLKHILEEKEGGGEEGREEEERNILKRIK